MAVEQFANNAATTLDAAITTVGETSITVTAYTGFPGSAQFRILIDSEIMLVTAGAGTATWTVTRGVEGSTAATHLDEAVVTHILTAGALAQLKLELMQVATINIIIDGGGAEIADATEVDVEIPYNCTISAVTALADQSGSIVVDLWMEDYANYPPADADTITSATPVTITTATKSQDSTLTNWITALVAGEILRAHVDSCTTIQRVTISLKVTRT